LLFKKGEERIEYVYGKRLLSSTYGTYLYNAHGDVVQLVKGEEVISRYDYTAYGSPMGELSEYQNDPNPYRYNGQYYDHESGYIYLRARYYSPKLGRFLNEDPAKSGNNWHAYGEGNPVLHEDPTGLFAVPIIGLVIVILFAVAVVSYTSTSSMRSSTKIQAPPVNKRQVAVSTALTAVPNWMLLGLAMTAVAAAGGTAASQRAKEVEAEKKQRQQEVLKEAAIGAAVMSRAQIAMARVAERANGIIDYSGRTAGEVIQDKKKGAINREFPSEWLDSTEEEIEKAAKAGNKSAQKAKKLLRDKRFDKKDNRK
jgi:RHS repeat-associated protein